MLSLCKARANSANCLLAGLGGTLNSEKKECFEADHSSTLELGRTETG